MPTRPDDSDVTLANYTASVCWNNAAPSHAPKDGVFTQSGVNDGNEHGQRCG
jgi:hypothetical protein